VQVMDALLDENDPGLHGEQADARRAAEAVPGGQLRQIVAAVESANVPAGQAEHTADDETLANVPWAHATHDD
jgi:hypothetical protein